MGRPAPIDMVSVDDLLLPFGSSRSLPAVAYRSPEVFGWEQAEIFASTWVCLGRTDDLVSPGQIRGIAHGAESVLLARDSGGTVRGFSNVCRHRGHTLVEPGEATDVRLVRCPYHSWTYRLDGSLRSAPTMTQSVDFDAEDWPLAAVAVDELMGWLFLDLCGTAPSLAETLRVSPSCSPTTNRVGWSRRPGTPTRWPPTGS